ncbi:MAG: multidrug effflux MFS transporter [Anaerolineae bacterium]|nr:multidrug effflux MFS transporter [Anaerolineae bacterium]
MHQPKKTIGFVEFVTLMAMMTSLTAMSIDAMLPALSEIGVDLGLQRANDSQLVISLFFLGMAVGQMFYGPLSDSIGRKPTIYIGFGLFVAGCLVSMLTISFQVMLVGRVLQGLGIAAPRAVVVALVRDLYSGRAMARVMSFVMAVLILVPVVAPTFGQAVLLIAHWRMIFGTYLMLVLVIGIWFARRQPETLPPDQRIPFSLIRIGRTIREIVTHRTAFGYTITAGLVSGAFIGYLNSTQQVFQEQYGLGRLFPLYFAIIALSLGGASTVNARLVLHFGMRALSFRALQGIITLSVIVLGIAVVTAGQPPLWSLTLYFLLTFFGIGILFGNLNALAMEPLGHIAGVGAAVVGSLSTFISLVLGTLIGQSYNGTVFPLIGGFSILSITAIGMMRWVETKRLLSQVN